MTFNQKQLKDFAEYSCSKLLSAREGVEYFSEPFKHVVIDDFFPMELAADCLRKFPDISDEGWEATNDADIEVKYRTTWQSEFDVPNGIIDAIRILNVSTRPAPPSYLS